MREPPTRPALRAKYDRKQQELVDAAARLFAQQGYSATSMADLVAATGMTAGGIYHYIDGKEALLVRICDELLDPLLERASTLVGEFDGPPDAELRALVRAWVEHVEGHLDHMVVFLQERRVLEGDPQWKRVRDARKRFERLLDDVLARCADAGLLAVEDRSIALRALLGAVNHTPQWYRRGGRLDAAAIAVGYCDLVLRAG
ncbi:TetR/AcrR family transcriptional regulator [Paraconexibacter algicola]|uniref:TetR/AcrR family transcriptional regulator n=1 Tax=Paraconexibacter algicola TaxID=2133960 RepID=UPI001304E4FA|nr:TetR/AcrR family transcriptional regulator [Paraconexibacter algicola]